jgi:hypothetical protein
MHARIRLVLFLASLVLPSALLAADAATTPQLDFGKPFWEQSAEERALVGRLSQEDHADMMRRLGVTKLRPGRNPNPGSTNPPNYDEARANLFPDWPPLLELADGRAVTTAEAWWSARRPEIVEAVEREVVGRVPASVPGVAWSVVETVHTKVGDVPAVARRLRGAVEGTSESAHPVNIRAVLVLPEKSRTPVPVLIMLGWARMPGEEPFRFPGMYEPPVPPSQEQLLAAGWGYVSLDAGSVQPDNGAGLVAGIIGATNRGARRTPEQWGALRAWAWGVSRTIDHLESLPEVDTKRIGVEGVSRYGKAALVAMAFEPRLAIALVASSGEGGTKPHRRDFGEAVENLAGSGAYHWMAGNFIKYAAEEAAFGRMDADDIPMDAHHLIALCAPRPVFVSYGIPENGDALWLDQQGSYMATVAAGEVYRLLDTRDLGDERDYRTATMPPVETGLLDGALAWRQHAGGHESRSNMSHFLAWAGRQLGLAAKVE